ncbi:MAG: amidohydrolase family protein [Clostridiales bacterium]
MKVYSGTIITCDKKNTTAKYLVEEKGKICYVGDTLPSDFAQAEQISLGEKVLIPAFADTHIHFASFATFHAGLNVMEAKSNEEILTMLKNHVQKSKEKLIIAFGASPYSVKEGHLVSKKQLDQVCPQKPVFLVKYDGHACVINSLLLEKLKDKISSLRGYHEETGEMNQEAFFAVSDYVTNSVSPLNLIKNMQRAADYMASKGIGMIHTVSGVGFPKDLDVDLERWVGKGMNNGMQLRVFFQTMDVSKVLKRKLPRIGGCFATALDGCFGSKDAALLSPYEKTEDKGILYYSDEEVIAFCKEANRAGLQIEMHAIGDAGFNQACRSLKAALEDYPRENHRHGIIHACLPTEEGLAICKKYQIMLSVQTAFINWEQEPDIYLEKILGKRSENLNPIRNFLDKELLVCAGSDGPCTDPDPITWIHKACNHSNPNQSITVGEALRMCTYNGYYASFDEKERGSLEMGKIADMVILSQNPLTAEVHRLKDIEVKQLLLQGKPYREIKTNPILQVLKGMI